MVSGPNSIQGTTYTDSRDQTYQFSEPSLDYQVSGATSQWHPQPHLPSQPCQRCQYCAAGPHREALFWRWELWWSTIPAWAHTVNVASTSGTASLGRPRRRQALSLHVDPHLLLPEAGALLLLLSPQAMLCWAVSQDPAPGSDSSNDQPCTCGVDYLRFCV